MSLFSVILQRSFGFKEEIAQTADIEGILRVRFTDLSAFDADAESSFLALE